MGIVEQYLLQLNIEKRRWRRAATILTVLSFLVAIGVSWNLRMTGITIANGASCGLEEHQHAETCMAEQVLSCGYDVEYPAEVPVEKPPEAPAEEPTEVPAEEPTEVPAEEPTEVPAEEPTEVPAEELAEVPAEEPTEVPAEEPAEALIEEAVAIVAEAPVEEATTVEVEIPAEEPAEKPAEKQNEKHIHNDACYTIIYQCGLEEHIHELSCYSDTTADLEDWKIWEESLPELTGQIAEDVVLVAKSQLGMGESEVNFEFADDTEIRNGITRYGQWYGNPYGPWSNMFTSFCLHYAGFTAAPLNSGAEVMRKDWEEAGLYRYTGNYEPLSGDIVFLDKNGNGIPEATAVIVEYFDGVLTVIEGDVDNFVVLQEYVVEDSAIIGYGVTGPERNLMMVTTPVVASGRTIAQRVDYSGNLLTNGGSFIMYATSADGRHYALDGNGEAVEVSIDSSGNIISNIADPTILYWEFTSKANWDNRPTHVIRNVSTGIYLHPNRDSGTYGPMHPVDWETALYNDGNGVKIRGARQNAYLQLNGTTFTIADNLNSGSVIRFGRGPTPVTLWLDGTNGNIMSYRGSDNTKYTVYTNIGMQLPSRWKSPAKYGYTLAGWVDIRTGDYYQPGDMIYVTGDTVLYADWVAITYDIGKYNSDVADTVSTNDFITTKVFDYSSLINLLSTNVSVNVSSSSHSETWSHVANGRVSYKGQNTLNFSFNDHDSSGTITNLNNLNDSNKYTGGTGVYSGIYNETLGEVLFGTDNLFDPENGTGIIGKHYLGEGDHLFQINTDPTSEYYGYYYYDAKLNAASYNQSEQRFYVYDYLARTSDSENNNDEGKYSDFLPLNSPYENTNGLKINTYTYQGEEGEYSGVTHYEYDARYDSDGSAANQVKANLWFGMRVDVQFGLPDVPGNKNGNKDIYGNDMHFKFTGDDDVWILIDGKVVLDLGGIHQAAEGEINFSTGEVLVNGNNAGTLGGINAGEHTLSILYLERGSSMSNCAIYFNLAPRFSLTLQKEDVLTQEVLNGAQFAFYHDLECTEPCELWPSKQAYKNGEKPTNVFTIQKGEAFVWGLSPSRTYYIREIAPPNASGYAPAKGVIRLTLDKNGLNSYSATILEGIDGNGNKESISHGYTVHGFLIDEENQAAYIVVTNAQNWVTETTSIYVEKKWNDAVDHTFDSVTVYLNITDPDGTIRRLREITLSEENDWKFTWTNLPKYILDEETMTESDIPVQYGVSEAYIPGYAPRIIKLENGTYSEESWAESTSFKNGDTYILKTNSGYLSAVAADQKTLCFIQDEAAAKASPLALWTATVSSGMVKLENQVGQSLTYYESGTTRYFYLTTETSNNQNLIAVEKNGGILLYYKKSSMRNYYFSALNQNSYADAKSYADSALTMHPLVKTVSDNIVELDGYGYKITNAPLTSETSLKVTKKWEHPTADASHYEKEEVTLRLYANGVYTGRSENVSLKTNWIAVFNGLPYFDDLGLPIEYTVVESWDNKDWIAAYGPVKEVGGENPSYETTVTNKYRWVDAFELPSTGGLGIHIQILCGLILVSAPLVYGLSLRRKSERRSEK